MFCIWLFCVVVPLRHVISSWPWITASYEWCMLESDILCIYIVACLFVARTFRWLTELIPSKSFQIPFSIILRQPSENFGRFYETFHGTDINIQVSVVNLSTLRLTIQTMCKWFGVLVFTLIHLPTPKRNEISLNMNLIFCQLLNNTIVFSNCRYK